MRNNQRNTRNIYEPGTNRYRRNLRDYQNDFPSHRLDTRNMEIRGSLRSIGDSVYFCQEDKKITEKLPETKIQDLSKLKDTNKGCTICIEDFKINDIAIYLPCFHLFHKNCIIDWIKKKPTCPLCKINIKENI